MNTELHLLFGLLASSAGLIQARPLAATWAAWNSRPDCSVADLEREVAVGELHPEWAERPDLRHRFLDEARITGQLDHPGIVPVHDLARGAVCPREKIRRTGRSARSPVVVSKAGKELDQPACQSEPESPGLCQERSDHE
jgi:hypothetical protein